jgi:polar amino acid transport system substrate-binding protein
MMMKVGIGIVFGLILLSHIPIIHAETVTMATGEWIPFTSANLNNYGKFTELVSIVLKEMQMEVEYRFYPWPRCYDAVIKGRVWAAFPYSHTEERAEKVMFTDALSCSRTVFFYYEKDKAAKEYQFRGIEDLRKFKIGGVAGYFYEELFRKAGLEVDYANKEISGLEKLKLGRIDLMPLNDLVGWHLIQTHFPDDAGKFKTLEKPLSVNTLHLIVSKGHPHSEELLVRFNAALKRCIEKGLIQIPACP